MASNEKRKIFNNHRIREYEWSVSEVQERQVIFYGGLQRSYSILTSAFCNSDVEIIHITSVHKLNTGPGGWFHVFEVDVIFKQLSTLEKKGGLLVAEDYVGKVTQLQERLKKMDSKAIWLMKRLKEIQARIDFGLDEEPLLLRVENSIKQIKAQRESLLKVLKVDEKILESDCITKSVQILVYKDQHALPFESFDTFTGFGEGGIGFFSNGDPDYCQVTRAHANDGVTVLKRNICFFVYKAQRIHRFKSDCSEREFNRVYGTRGHPPRVVSYTRPGDRGNSGGDQMKPKDDLPIRTIEDAIERASRIRIPIPSSMYHRLRKFGFSFIGSFIFFKGQMVTGPSFHSIPIDDETIRQVELTPLFFENYCSGLSVFNYHQAIENLVKYLRVERTGIAWLPGLSTQFPFVYNNFASYLLLCLRNSTNVLSNISEDVFVFSIIPYLPVGDVYWNIDVWNKHVMLSFCRSVAFEYEYSCSDFSRLSSTYSNEMSLLDVEPLLLGENEKESERLLEQRDRFGSVLNFYSNFLSRFINPQKEKMLVAGGKKEDLHADRDVIAMKQLLVFSWDWLKSVYSNRVENIDRRKLGYNADKYLKLVLRFYYHLMSNGDLFTKSANILPGGSNGEDLSMERLLDELFILDSLRSYLRKCRMKRDAKLLSKLINGLLCGTLRNWGDFFSFMKHDRIRIEQFTNINFIKKVLHTVCSLPNCHSLSLSEFETFQKIVGNEVTINLLVLSRSAQSGAEDRLMTRVKVGVIISLLLAAIKKKSVSNSRAVSQTLWQSWFGHLNSCIHADDIHAGSSILLYLIESMHEIKYFNSFFLPTTSLVKSILAHRQRRGEESRIYSGADHSRLKYMRWMKKLLRMMLDIIHSVETNRSRWDIPTARSGCLMEYKMYAVNLINDFALLLREMLSIGMLKMFREICDHAVTEMTRCVDPTEIEEGSDYHHYCDWVIFASRRMLKHSFLFNAPIFCKMATVLSVAVVSHQRCQLESTDQLQSLGYLKILGVVVDLATELDVIDDKGLCLCDASPVFRKCHAMLVHSLALFVSRENLSRLFQSVPLLSLFLQSVSIIRANAHCGGFYAPDFSIHTCCYKNIVKGVDHQREEFFRLCEATLSRVYLSVCDCKIIAKISVAKDILLLRNLVYKGSIANAVQSFVFNPRNRREECSATCDYSLFWRFLLFVKKLMVEKAPSEMESVLSSYLINFLISWKNGIVRCGKATDNFFLKAVGRFSPKGELFEDTTDNFFLEVVGRFSPKGELFEDTCNILNLVFVDTAVVSFLVLLMKECIATKDVAKFHSVLSLETFADYLSADFRIRLLMCDGGRERLGFIPLDLLIEFLELHDEKLYGHQLTDFFAKSFQRDINEQHLERRMHFNGKEEYLDLLPNNMLPIEEGGGTIFVEKHRLAFRLVNVFGKFAVAILKAICENPASFKDTFSVLFPVCNDFLVRLLCEKVEMNEQGTTQPFEASMLRMSCLLLASLNAVKKERKPRVKCGVLPHDNLHLNSFPGMSFIFFDLISISPMGEFSTVIQKGLTLWNMNTLSSDDAGELCIVYLKIAKFFLQSLVETSHLSSDDYGDVMGCDCDYCRNRVRSHSAAGDFFEYMQLEVALKQLFTFWPTFSYSALGRKRKNPSKITLAILLHAFMDVISIIEPNEVGDTLLVYLACHRELKDHPITKSYIEFARKNPEKLQSVLKRMDDVINLEQIPEIMFDNRAVFQRYYREAIGEIDGSNDSGLIAVVPEQQEGEKKIIIDGDSGFSFDIGLDFDFSKQNNDSIAPNKKDEEAFDPTQQLDKLPSLEEFQSHVLDFDKVGSKPPPFITQTEVKEEESVEATFGNDSFQFEEIGVGTNFSIVSGEDGGEGSEKDETVFVF